MKKILNILLTSIIICSLTGCKSNNINDCVTRYAFSLSFVDSNGDDLLELLVDDNNRSTEGQIDLTILPSNPNPNIEGSLVDYQPYNAILYKGETDNYYYPILLTFVSHQKTINFEIICPKVFNDNNKHIFETYWGKSNGKYDKCTKVLFEGKQYAPINYEVNGSTWNRLDVIVTNN